MSKTLRKTLGLLIEFVVRVTLRFLQVSVRFVLQKIYGSQRNKLPPITDPILLESATGLAAKIRNRKLKAEDVVRAYVTRIREVNPYINAIVDDRYVDAIEEAKKVDAYLQSNNVSEQDLMKDKPFLGVPFTSKNSVPIKGLIVDAGLVMLKGTLAKEDSQAVALMKKAGAIPLAVTNVPELCLWTDASNKVYGKTNNPYDLTRIPGGSSGGEGALITSGGSIVGLGSDIGGSIRLPSFCCGLFGHKPTRKTVSTKGQIPSTFGTELDNYNSIGPICRYAVDLLPMLKVLAGENADKWKMDTKVDLKKLKVFYTEDYIDDMFTTPVSEEMKDSVRKVILHLEKAFGISAQRVSFPEMDHGYWIWLTKITAADEDFNETKGETKLNLPWEFLKSAFGLSNHTFHRLFFMLQTRYSPAFYPQKKAMYDALHAKLQSDMERTLGNDGVMIFPTFAEPAVYHQEQILYWHTGAYTSTISSLGFPVTQCPTGFSKTGLPLGVQVIGNYRTDHQTIAVANELEKGFGGWRSPASISEKLRT